MESAKNHLGEASAEGNEPSLTQAPKLAIPAAERPLGENVKFWSSANGGWVSLRCRHDRRAAPKLTRREETGPGDA
jgi:hypothetical protein